MGVCMSIAVGNNQVAPEEEDNPFDMMQKVEDNSCTSCLKKIFCFLCI
tara:strand:- start:818 stop:961 length:144 start_codon:yes stop_codon:yes gene_type:complete